MKYNKFRFKKNEVQQTECPFSRLRFLGSKVELAEGSF